MDKNGESASNLLSELGENKIRASYKYWPYRWSVSLGSSASLKSRSKPWDWREWKKMECEDLSEKSSSRTRIRRSVGFSGEKEWQSKGRSESTVMKVEILRILSLSLSLPA